MTDTLTRLRQLHEAASPAPWGNPATDEWFLSPDDEELIIAARNALPHLLNIAEASADILNDGKVMLRPSQIDRLRQSLAALETA